MKSKLTAFYLSLLLLLSVFSLAEESPLTIIALNFPCYDAARQVAGERAEVKMLLPPGTENHGYEPSPQDIIAVQNADLFIYVGGESDTWVEGILDSFGEEAPHCLSLTECVSLLEEEQSPSMAQEAEEESEEESEEEAEMDEHVWTSPCNMMMIASRICDELCVIAPELAGDFRGNTAAFLAGLTELDAAFREAVENGCRRTIIFGDRFPLRYFAAEYGLEYDAAFPGCSEDSEPSVHSVVSLIDRIREEGISAVFYIEYSSCRTADILAEETGVKELLFHSCHNISAEEMEQGATYLALMWRNVDTLREALSK